ncbi:PAPLN [Cordylochernes scorpioides]|uniref:PAPLN n=1 Tax=Cordylochernes scorpioides TaxID=51811 RepID=A0ABY6L2T6_9ARAC|nr:PAPLN [Cordylochernes scorpioides]
MPPTLQLPIKLVSTTSVPQLERSGLMKCWVVCPGDSTAHSVRSSGPANLPGTLGDCPLVVHVRHFVRYDPILIPKYQRCVHAESIWVQDCPEGSPDFRADQCSRYDPVPFEGKFYTWIPYTKATNPCELTCMPQGEGFYYRQARSVIDGTSCGDRRVCVENSCVPIGCDGQLGSELEEDKCHECGGRGRNCHTILGTYTEDNLQVGYNDILLVPAGATNLVVKERAPSPNYLAVRNLTGHFYLNGRWRLDLPRELHFAGTTFRYDRPAERLEAPGPTTESLFIALLYQTQNTGVDYEYSVPREVHVSANGTYSWTTDSELGPCSASCGRGVREQRVRCIETTGAREVSSHLCDPRERPSTSAPCPDLKPCPAKWVVKGPWGPCQDGRQERTLQCDGEDCSHVPRPENPSRSCELEFGPWSECSGPCGSQRRQARGGGAVQERACRTEACAAEWLTGEWGGCPECGLLESRTVACADAKGRPLPTDDLCDPTRRPPNTRPCPGCQGPPLESLPLLWLTEQQIGAMFQCSASCGPVGVQTREVSCVSSDCQGEVPVSQRPCHPAPPPCPPLWLTGPWDKVALYFGFFIWFVGVHGVQCSSSCGGGRRLRLVVCHDAGSLTAPDLCDPVTRPFGEEACNMLPCDEDEVMVVGRSCQHSPHGCCPDGLTPAGPHGCPDTLGSPANCTQAEFGCCDDGVTPAAGPFRRGCPRAQREQAVGSGDAEVEGSGDDCQPHGCCPDGVTPALGPDNLGCCRASLYGCCPDNKTEALGPAAKGCPCTSHPHGCCSDGRTPAHGPGPPQDMAEELLLRMEVKGAERLAYVKADLSEPSRPNMGKSERKLHADGVKEGTKPGKEKCILCKESHWEQHCSAWISLTIRKRVEDLKICKQNHNNLYISGRKKEKLQDEAKTFEKCDNEEASSKQRNKDISFAGMQYVRKAVPNALLATALVHIFNRKGEMVVVRALLDQGSQSSFNCRNVFQGIKISKVASRYTASTLQEIGKGCECHATKYGCCPDKYTAARGPDMEGCPCSTHVYGCCPDGKTLAQGEELKGCPCSTHSYGCCPDGLSIAHGSDMEGCLCSTHVYGCCPDGVSIAQGPDMEGCPCSAHSYGCCPDGLSIAHGPDMEGCPCSAHTYGCCPDGLSIAHGPDMEGCPCSAHTYGCCPDGKTAAKGPEQAGCPCEAHPYGCCPDEKTPAQGPDMEGCPCYAHRHGCCPDGKTAAKGPELEGCPCSSHTYGCCPDGKTPAQGPDQEGCPCSAHPHGCCPDGKTSAKGPELEGCPCSSHIYGCCPDGKTPAQGPEMEGCLCASFPHGCCADGKTPAKGPEMQGCPCKATPHGCCPDGRTPATGPSYAGCGCMVSEFGCCPDGATPAQGPRYDGCPCASSPYGCCPDGVSIAYGPNFEECGESAAEVLTSVGDVCSLDKERGPCHNYTVKWYFDMAYGGCSRFWYGGCDGNGNRFATLEACEQACVAPEGAEVCKLPKVAGPCEGQYPSWYFDPTSRTCRHFVYGGCLGNNNRFSSRQTCEEACVFHDVADPCDQPKVTGPCRGHFPRWYYDRVRSECRPFTYGGCKGNDNNFVTEEACVQQCAVATTHSKDVCALPRDPGPCQDALPRWYHDTAASTCLQFKYSGCEGNANRFKSRERCEATCVAGSSNRCQLPGEPGPCAKTLPRWHFDASLGRCRPFIYGGCKGNANRFETRQECEGACAPPQLPPSDQGPGSSVMNPSSGFAILTHHILDYHTFGDVAAACELPQEIGNCYHFQERWFHAGEGRCQQFYYSGCGGNANNFASHHECSALCGDSGEEFRVDQCFLALEAGDTACDGRDLRWFYDRSDGVCKEFYFTGCGGNANRFESRRECEGKCGPAQDVCGLPAAAGACSGSFLQWHFDGHVCREFVYTGCHGNANRFDSRQACEQRCGGRTTTALATTGDVCQEPEDPGPCLGQLPQWFYDSAQRQCRTFLYGGCEGNSNRFETRQDCEQRCIRPEKSKRKKEEHLGNIVVRAIELVPCRDSYTRLMFLPRGAGVCREPVALGSCLQPQSRWYYDPALLRCRTFTYSGCGGNKNRFKTFETCMRFCSGIKPGRSSECPQCDQSLHCEFGLLAEPADGCPSCRCAPDPCLACPNGTWCELERRNDTEPVTATCKPSWETREAESGENVTLECPFSGEITWSRDSALLSTGGPRLHLTVVEVEDSGVYSCRRHEGPSYNFNLTVHRKLEVKVPEGEVVLGTAAEIRCEGTTSPVTWLHNGTHISEEPSKPKLRIAAVQAQDAGLYQCSEGGRVSAPSELRVKETVVYIYICPPPLHIMCCCAEIPVPANCTDLPHFANCELIVRASFCKNVYYAKFCCRTCTLAGQL